MPYTVGNLSEWSVTVTLDGDTHLILMTAQDEDDARQQIEAHHGRRTLLDHDVACHGVKKLRVDWGNVRECSVGDVALVRTWGPDGEIRIRPQTAESPPRE
jgi:hypothetical protein